MTAQNKLKETIDRMVEDSIRRILPTVMNEVLLRTIASSGVMQERRAIDKPGYPYIPDNGGKKIKVVSRPPAPVPKRKGGRPDLSHLLDETAGADFYAASRQPDPVYETVEQEDDEEAPPLRERVARNIEALPPELQEMAEGIELEDDDGEMWGEEEAVVPRGDDAGPLDTTARRVGVDFSRMRDLTRMTEAKKPKISAEDARANAQFETLRLKRMREKLNGGKPVE